MGYGLMRVKREFNMCSMATGEGGGAGSGGGEVAHLMGSLAPLFQHFAGALQQSGDPTPLQQQVLSLQWLLIVRVGEVFLWLKERVCCVKVVGKCEAICEVMR